MKRASTRIVISSRHEGCVLAVPHRQRTRSPQRCAPCGCGSCPNSSCRSLRICSLVWWRREIDSTRRKRRIVATMGAVGSQRRWSDLCVERALVSFGRLANAFCLGGSTGTAMRVSPPPSVTTTLTRPTSARLVDDVRQACWKSTCVRMAQGRIVKAREDCDEINSPFSGKVGSVRSSPTGGMVACFLVGFGPGREDGRLEAIGSVPPQAEANPLVSGPMRPSCLRLWSCASATLCSLAKPCCLSWARWNIWARS